MPATICPHCRRRNLHDAPQGMERRPCEFCGQPITIMPWIPGGANRPPAVPQFRRDPLPGMIIGISILLLLTALAMTVARKVLLSPVVPVAAPPGPILPPAK